MPVSKNKKSIACEIEIRYYKFINNFIDNYNRKFIDEKRITKSDVVRLLVMSWLPVNHLNDEDSLIHSRMIKFFSKTGNDKYQILSDELRYNEPYKIQSITAKKSKKKLTVTEGGENIGFIDYIVYAGVNGSTVGITHIEVDKMKRRLGIAIRMIDELMEYETVDLKHLLKRATSQTTKDAEGLLKYVRTESKRKDKVFLTKEMEDKRKEKDEKY